MTGAKKAAFPLAAAIGAVIAPAASIIVSSYGRRRRDLAHGR